MSTASTRVGIGTYTVPRAVAAGRMNQIELLKFARECGAEVVQFCENLSLFALDGVELENVIQYAAANDIQLEIGMRTLRSEALDAGLRLSQRVGARQLRVVIDDAGYEPSFEVVLQILAEVAPQFVSRGVNLAIENHDRFTSHEFMRMAELPGVSICLDTANSFGCLEGVESLERMCHVSTCFHAKPVRVTRKPDMLGFDILGVSFSDGQMDVVPLLRHCSDLQSVILEHWTPLSDFNADPSIELAWTQQGLRRLKEDWMRSRS